MDDLKLLEHVPICAKVVSRDLKLMYMSKAGIEGLSIDDITEFYGKPYPLEFYPDDFRTEMISRLQRAGETGEPDLMEGAVKNLDGEVRWYQSSIAPIRGANGEVESFNVVSIDTTKRHLAEEALLNSKKQLQALASELVLAEEKERKRIGTLLHDGICQNLTYLNILLEKAGEKADGADEAPCLNKANEMLGEIQDDIRSLILDLSAPELQERGLEGAVEQWLARRVEDSSPFRTELVSEGEQRSLDADIETLLFRSVRELVTNAVKHSQADLLMVKLLWEVGQLCIMVKDDGVGFPIQHVGEECNGLGLFSIRERMNQLGGSFEVNTAPGKGCEAVLRVPLC
ncbi:Oxygen sensor histidine kinase NreB [Pontiella desulfatans]|uniref:Oxygen sensor histidine kinase NreB n=1 Tax=Pontiella desulfatans TaxID=2750659 RepID=A0A6C2U210_PONDE|nr:ATP-binding protein [Pontiella desulfatans]VGO14018.1 Oxygen sensor histidine kinase NreB [Pontiella desulfatans]